MDGLRPASYPTHPTVASEWDKGCSLEFVFFLSSSSDPTPTPIDENLVGGIVDQSPALER